MRDFATFLPRFWTTGPGKKFRGDPDAQLVSVYLITAPGSNHIGIYYLPIGTIAHDCGLSEEGASKGLRRAIEGAFCHYDAPSEHVFVVEMAQIQILERADQLNRKDKRVAGIKRELLKYRKSIHFSAFVARYREAFYLTEPEFQDKREAPCKPLTSPFEGASLKRQETGDRRQETGSRAPARAHTREASPETEWFSIDTIEQIFSRLRKAAGGKGFKSQQSTYNILQGVVDWAEAEAPLEGCKPAELVERSAAAYMATGNDKRRANGFPFKWWAEDPGAHLPGCDEAPDTGPLAAELAAAREKMRKATEAGDLKGQDAADEEMQRLCEERRRLVKAQVAS